MKMAKTQKKSGKKPFYDSWTFFFIMVGIILVVRIFAYSHYVIPSGSMMSSLREGDFIIANKYVYGYNHHTVWFLKHLPFKGHYWEHKTPTPGEVVIFAPPHHLGIDFIKRVVAGPGDKVQVVAGQLFINDKKIQREFVDEVELTLRNKKNNNGLLPAMRYIETLPNGSSYTVLDSKVSRSGDHFGPITVPEEHYFVLGDNRNHSQDSRFIGTIPRSHIIGRAQGVIFSTEEPIWKFWHWFGGFRGERLFMPMKEAQQDLPQT